MELKFEFMGAPGIVRIRNPVPDNCGDIVGMLYWCDLENSVVFRSLEDAEDFVSNEDRISEFICDSAESEEDL